jgi:hypothetical protein
MSESNTRTYIREFFAAHPKVKWGVIAVAALCLFGIGRCAFAQTPTIDLTSNVSTAVSRATPTLTLSVMNQGSRVVTCTASGGWSGAKSPGPQVQPEITATTTYTISCSAPAIAGDTQAVLNWLAPTSFTDGSPLTPATHLSGYEILFGTSATTLNQSRAHNFPTSLTATVTGLTSGSTYFFCVKAVGINAPSACSNTASKALAAAVPAWSATDSVTVTITQPQVPNPPTNLQVVAQAAHEVDLKIRSGRLVWLLGKEIGTVALGTPCRKDFRIPDTEYFRVDANRVTFNSSRDRTFLPVARCQVQPVQVEVG